MNLDQVRADDAFSFVQGLAKGEEQEKFLGIARKLPAMLQTNGLLATWAYLLSKKKVEGRAAEALLAHFRRAGLDVPAEGAPTDVFTRVWVRPGLSSRRLRQLTHEAIVYSVWLKRAAEALCDTGAPAAPAAAPEEARS